MGRRTRAHDDTWKSSALEHLAEDGGDPGLQREVYRATAVASYSSRGFRQAWDRFRVLVSLGR